MEPLSIALIYRISKMVSRHPNFLFSVLSPNAIFQNINYKDFLKTIKIKTYSQYPLLDLMHAQHFQCKVMSCSY